VRKKKASKLHICGDNPIKRRKDFVRYLVIHVHHLSTAATGNIDLLPKVLARCIIGSTSVVVD